MPPASGRETTRSAHTNQNGRICDDQDRRHRRQHPAAIRTRSGGRSGRLLRGVRLRHAGVQRRRPASPQNAIDYLGRERTRKAVSYVGYGVFGAVTAVQELRAQAGRLQMADIGPQVVLSLRAAARAVA